MPVVTIGITPDHPVTGFGYIECGSQIKTDTATDFRAVGRFVEKPDEKTENRYLRTVRFCWNSGMFVWKVSTMARAFLSHAPDIAGLIGKIEKAKSIRLTQAKAYPMPLEFSAVLA